MKKLDNKGNAAILLCLVVTALFGFTALGIDVGLTFTEQIRLSNALDASALAASLELPNGDEKARSVAIDYLEKNDVDPGDAVITVAADHKSIEIQKSENVEHLFAPVIGIENSNVAARSKAIIGPAKKVTGGIRPFAVQAYDFSYGYTVTLKEGAGGGYNGNYRVVALGGSGSSVYKANALYGYNGTISVGDYIDTEPGNMTGATNAIKNYIDSECSTFDNFPRDSIRLWTIPIVDTLAVNGRNQIQVTGFAEFFVEGTNNRSGHMDITGRFIKYVSNSSVDEDLKFTGLYGAKLSR